MTSEEKRSIFQSFNYDNKYIEETLKNNNLSDKLYAVLKASKLSECDKDTGSLLKEIASSKKKITGEQHDLLIQYTADKKIDSKVKLEEAYNYFSASSTIDIEAFEKASGVGVHVTQEMVESYVDSFLVNNKEMFIIENGNFRNSNIMKLLKEGMKFAPGGDLNKYYMIKGAEFVKGLNITKTEEKKPNKKEALKKDTKKDEFLSVEELNQNYRIENLDAKPFTEAQKNCERLNLEHFAFSKGKIITRFPPEPNGFLHIGHCKSIRFNFS